MSLEWYHDSAVTKIFFQDQDPVVQDLDQDQDFSFKTKTFCLPTDNKLSQKWQNIYYKAYLYSLF